MERVFAKEFEMWSVVVLMMLRADDMVDSVVVGLYNWYASYEREYGTVAVL